MITSASNPKLRYVRHLGRRSFRVREKRLVLEGVRLVEEALAANNEPAFVLVSETLRGTERGVALLARLDRSGAPVATVDTKLLNHIAGTTTPQGVVAVVPTPDLAVPDLPTLVMALDGVQDPGNVGTALRTAHAAGADAALLAPGSADPTSAKVVRAAMGAHFHLPIRRATWDEIEERCAAAGLTAWVAESSADAIYTAVDLTEPSMIIVGGEVGGPSTEAFDLATAVRIPMPGSTESLNAGVAAAVILFEAVRQRRT